MDQTIRRYRPYLLVQPPVVPLLFAMAMSGTIFIDLVVYRTCLITMGMNETECRVLHENSSSAEALRINLLVQPHASLITMCKFLIESILPSCLSLFLGPWSDRYGRKPIILSGYIGVCLTFLLLSVMASQDISPWYLLIAYVPIALMGGVSILMLGSICYITDITNDNERGWHLAWLDALINLGLLIGLLVGPKIFELYGYTTVFAIATVSCIIATLYIASIPETVQSRSFMSGIYKIFDVEIIKNLINTCIKKRDGFDRTLVWSCIVCLTFLLITMQGDLAIGYLFTSARLGWTVDTFSFYVAVNIIVGIFGTIFGIKLMRNYAGLPEAVVAIISVTSALASALVCAFTLQSWHMYLSMVLGVFSEVCRPMIRAILSKAVLTQDTGKVFSLATCLETSLPFAATSLYTFLYSSYMPPLYPLPVWFLSVAFFIMTIVVLIYIQMQIVKHNNVSHVSPLLIQVNDHVQYHSIH